MLFECMKQPPRIKDLRRWLESAKLANKTHVIIMHDSFSRGFYPWFVDNATRARRIYQNMNNRSGVTVMEVYSMKRDVREQLNAERAFYFD